MDILPQGVPLLEEEVLEIGEKFNVLPELLPVAPEGPALSQADVLVRPLQPAFHAEVLFHRHVEGVVLQPEILLGKGRHSLPVPGEAVPKGGAEHLEPGIVYLPVVHIPGISAPVRSLQSRPVQKALLG